LFDKQTRYNKRRPETYRRNQRLVCRPCKAHLRCAKCLKAYDTSYWTRNERRNKRNSTLQSKLVCKDCRERGIHPRDLKTYTCQSCNIKFGAKKFHKVQLSNYRQKLTIKLNCLQCTQRIDARLNRLREILKSSRRICRCHSRIHKAKCPLTPVAYGEQRWPVSDVGITENDRSFLDKLHPCPPWWAKAWGR